MTVHEMIKREGPNFQKKAPRVVLPAVGLGTSLVESFQNRYPHISFDEIGNILSVSSRIDGYGYTFIHFYNLYRLNTDRLFLREARKVLKAANAYADKKIKELRIPIVPKPEFVYPKRWMPRW